MIAADHVSLDLGGFVISGNGAGSAITTSGPSRRDITVHDGAVNGFSIGMSFCGSVASGTGARDILVYRVRATQNSGAGISTCEGSATVRDSVANENGAGISLGQFYGSNLVTGCVASRNTTAGIVVWGGGTVIGNTADRNGSSSPLCTGPFGAQACAGIFVDRASTVVNNTASRNKGLGIFAICPSNILGNTAVDNGMVNPKTFADCNIEHNAFTFTTALIP